MGKTKTPREQRAARLRRLEINELVDEYRRVVPRNGEQRAQLIREELMRSILDFEFPEPSLDPPD